MGEVVRIFGREESPVTPEVKSALEPLVRSIEGISQKTEKIFLEFGGELQDVSRKSREISENALSASAIMSGDEIRGAIDGLNEMVHQLEALFENTDDISSRNVKSLNDIGQSLYKVKKGLGDLRDNSRDLKMLALSTKIQSTRTGGNAKAFMQLGFDIAGMSEIIEEKSTGLMGDTGTLDDLVGHVRENLQHLKDRHRCQTRSVVVGSRNIIQGLTFLNARAGDEVQKIRRGSSSITRSIDELIVSVQYQDITRQSLEMVVGELQKAQSGTYSSASDDGTVDETKGYSSGILAVGMCKKQTQCLLETGEKLGKAVESISRNLQIVLGHIESMAVVTAEASRESSRFLVELEAGMESVTAYLSEVAESGKEMSGAMSSLAGTVDDMSRFIGDIEMISSEVELIALNTRVMAAQKGSGGAGMSVIAEAVQKTAGNSERQRLTLVELFQDVSAGSIALKEEIEKASSGVNVQYDQLVRELGVFLDALGIMQKKIVSMLNDIDVKSRALHEQIDQTVGKMHAQEKIMSEVTSVARGLEGIAERLCGSIDEEELFSLTAGEFDYEEVARMGVAQRLAMIKDHLSESGLLRCFEEERQGDPDDDAVLF